MICVDMSQVMISNLMVSINTFAKDMEVNENLIRHMVLNSLRSYRSKFSETYGELILCYDAPNSWRKEVFPHYKNNRKKNRSNSDLDWKLIFECFGNLQNDLVEYFPYPILYVDRAEADDIIAVVVSEETRNTNDPLLIISGDKDFIQLKSYGNVRQYSPVLKKFIEHDNPTLYLKEHIIRGDASDGIPNIMSPDDCFMTDKRQTPIRTKKIEEWISSGNLEFLNDQMEKRYHQNRQLIDLTDLTLIPSSIVAAIKSEYQNEVRLNNSRDRSRLFNYFVSKRLNNLMDVIHEF